MWDSNGKAASTIREKMLSPLIDVELTEEDELRAFPIPSRTDETVLVKRKAEGRIAEDIRKRLGITDETPVFITEAEGVFQIGDSTWENFQKLLIECGEHKIDFSDSSSSGGNFAAFLNWIEGASWG